MDEQEHLKRHQELHRSLDELLADWITQKEIIPSQATVLELITWSHQQTQKPDHLAGQS